MGRKLYVGNLTFETTASELPAPAPEAVATAERLRPRLSYRAQLDIRERTGAAQQVRRESEQVAGGRPEPAGRPPRDRVLHRPRRPVTHLAFLDVTLGRARRLLEARVLEPERLEKPLLHRLRERHARGHCGRLTR